MQSLTEGIENSADLDCGKGTAGPADPGAAITAMAGSGTAGDLTALPAAGASTPEIAASAAAPQATAAATVPQAPAADASAARPAGAAKPVAAPPAAGLFRTWMAWIVELQTAFNRDLTAGLKGAKAGDPLWWLGGVSFLYGIVHAAGPGHGKVVISSYLLANEARLRRGVTIAFISAFLQAVVAVAIIGVMAAILNMTSLAITSTAKTFEAGSFALVALLGIYLLVRKGRAAWAVMRGGDPHAHHHHHHHDHHHDDDAHHHHDHPHYHAHGAPHGGAAPRGAHAAPAAACSHAHVPAEAALARPGFAGAAAAVLSVGVRPCSGALVVLVFALSQGVFWAGVASTFVMALGTAITVAALAALAVGAKDVARRLARGDDRRGSQVMLGLELAAAFLITLLGAVLFAGAVLA
jgi:ABC-type nickel/cobalt efflux system permease component RcnA